MHVDDRLATVLSARGDSKVALRIQYRQLLDLVGTSPVGARGDLLDAAMVRLAELAEVIPAPDRARAVAEAGVRLRSPALVALLAADDPAVALAAIRAARLDERQWLDLIPAMPLSARGLLHVRRDLGAQLQQRLDQLGITGRTLPGAPGAAEQAIGGETDAAATTGAGTATAVQPEPESVTPSPAISPADPLEASVPDPAESLPAAGPLASEAVEGIGAIVRRIEAFRRKRESGAIPSPANDSPRLPLDEFEPTGTAPAAFSFATDSAGRIGWADGGIAPCVTGMLLQGLAQAGSSADEGSLGGQFRRRLPIRAARVLLEGAPVIAGDWQLDAAPEFDAHGRFTGYLGRFRRPAAPAAPARNPEADRIRQVLHELRTPVNAIQGFSEVIQQQLFGPTPHEYRALAATIAGDAARMLAGFDELDRYARLDSGSAAPEPGRTDLAMVVAGTVHQLETFTGARSSGFALSAPPGELIVGIAPEETEHLVWRLLATLAGAALPGEVLALDLAAAPDATLLRAQLPDGLAAHEDLFEAMPPQSGQAINAGVFGSGFTLRLAAAEARAAGGSLTREGGALHLVLPHEIQVSANNHLQSHVMVSAGSAA